MFSGASPARSSSRKSGRAGVVPQSSVSSRRALIQNDSDQGDSPYTTDSEPDSTASDELSSSSNTTFSEDSKPGRGSRVASRCGLALKLPEHVYSGGSGSNSELEDIYESDDDDDDETPVVEYDWDKLFAQGKKGQDESKLIRYVLPGDEDKLEDRLEDTEAAWPDYQQDILTPVNSPTDPYDYSVAQGFSEAVTEISSKLEQNLTMDSNTPATGVLDSTTVSSTTSNLGSSDTSIQPGTNNGTSTKEMASKLTTTNSIIASSTAENTQSTSLISKSETSYGSMQSRTQEILSQRTGHPVVRSQPSAESMGSCQDNWERLFANESSRGSSELPPPYSPPRGDSLVAGINCPASLSAGKASSYGTGDDPLITEGLTPPQPRMAIVARQPSFDHGPRRNFMMDPRSKRFFCQICMKEIDSSVRSRPKTIAWVTGWVLCCIGVMGIARCDYGCCLIPCCFDPCLVITHSCPHCEAEVVQEDNSGIE